MVFSLVLIMGDANAHISHIQNETPKQQMNINLNQIKSEMKNQTPHFRCKREMHIKNINFLIKQFQSIIFCRIYMSM